jgi:calcium-dependent protein kinase
MPFTDWFAPAVGRTRDKYDLDCTSDLLGYGSFGKVLNGRNKVTGSVCAVKQIEKTLRNRAGSVCVVKQIEKEIEIMQRLNHPHIVKLLNHFEDENCYYIAMELCAGGKLIDFIARGHHYRESDTATIMQQVFSAVEHLHERHIVHLDLKPDNMLFEMRNPIDPISQNRVKLIDFGISCNCSFGQPLRKSAGTPEYMAPEVIDTHFGTPADMWSCGVAMFELLSGCIPFRGETEAGIFAMIRRGNFTFAESAWGGISQDAKDLIRTLLKLNPRERLSAQEASAHAWTRYKPHATQSCQLLSALRHFRNRSAKKKCVVEEDDALGNVRAALRDVSEAALRDVTHWANSIFAQTMVDDNIVKNADRSSYWL